MLLHVSITYKTCDVVACRSSGYGRRKRPMQRATLLQRKQRTARRARLRVRRRHWRTDTPRAIARKMQRRARPQKRILTQMDLFDADIRSQALEANGQQAALTGL